jgi:REP element-mobilizing transposase RayT
MSIIEKKHRLPIGLYKGTIRATFTVCTKGKMPLFTNDEVVNVFVENLRISNEKYQISNWCYVFMPDHIHILNEGKTKDSDLWKGVCLFKQYCGYYLAKHFAQAKACGYRDGSVAAGFSLREGDRIELQKDFYDHIHRKDEDLITHIRYLLDNPVRKGLINNWQDYKFKGSLDYNLMEICAA